MFKPFQKKTAGASKDSPFANSKQPPTMAKSTKSDPKARLAQTLMGLEKAK